MTTSGDSVWDRGPSEAAGEPSGMSGGPSPAPRPLPERPDPAEASTTGSPAPAVVGRRPSLARVVAAIAAVGVVAAAAVWATGLAGDGDGDPARADGGSTTVPAPLPPVTPPTTALSSTRPVTRPAPSTTTPTTSVATTPPTTTPPSTTTPAPTPTPNGARVDIVGSIAPCAFGSECLVAGFSAHGFDGVVREFVCEFGDGSRHTFRFDGVGADRACATADADGTITIEVGGVRSETATR